jgi:hypothetical protein
MTYTLKVVYNAVGFKRVTVTVSQRNKGVVFEAHENTVLIAMKRVADFVSINNGEV